MNQNWIILITYSIFFIVEVNHDYILSSIRRYLLKSKDPLMLDDDDERRLNADWHLWDFIGHAILAFLVSWLAFFYENYHWPRLLIVLEIACLRMLILNIGLNIKWEKKNKLYLGQGSVDQALGKIFGNWWPVPIILILLLCIFLNL